MTRTDKPDLDSAPDSCEYNTCDKSPTMTIRYIDPKEYVCYCRTHADEQFSELPNAKYRSRLR